MKLKTQYSVVFFIRRIALLVMIFGCNNNSSRNSSTHPGSDDSSKVNSHQELKNLGQDNLNNKNIHDFEKPKNYSKIFSDFIQVRALLSAA